MGRDRDERLAGAGRRRQDHVRPRHDLDDRLVLRGVEREPLFGRPLDEAQVDGVGVGADGHVLERGSGASHESARPGGETRPGRDAWAGERMPLPAVERTRPTSERRRDGRRVGLLAGRVRVEATVRLGCRRDEPADPAVTGVAQAVAGEGRRPRRRTRRRDRGGRSARRTQPGTIAMPPWTAWLRPTTADVRHRGLSCVELHRRAGPPRRRCTCRRRHRTATGSRSRRSARSGPHCRTTPITPASRSRRSQRPGPAGCRGAPSAHAPRSEPRLLQAPRTAIQREVVDACGDGHELRRRIRDRPAAASPAACSATSAVVAPVHAADTTVPPSMPASTVG